MIRLLLASGLLAAALVSATTAEAAPGREIVFALDVQARWVRVVADRDCTATAWLTYR
jgi:hypothetical protein